MKTLITILALTLSLQASASNLFVTDNDVLSCVTEQGNLVKINLKYGEITEMDQLGSLLRDYDDGYDWSSLQLESFPAQESVRVFHHEEPKISVVSLRRMVGDHGPYSRTYLNTKNQKVTINCIL